ncbi:MAG: radical SAM/SPASM domain-containing protein [Promethearchaeota archaeon]
MKYQPKFIVWELTLACNAKCKHCASNAGPKRIKELNTQEAFNLIEQLELAGTECIFLSGGEPTLRADFYDIAKKIDTSNMIYGFVTNGLTKLNVDFLKRYSPFTIGVSIDGTEKTHNDIRGMPDAFNRTWAIIRELVKNNLPVSIVTAVSKYNFKDIKRIELDILYNKVGAWQLQMVIPEGRMDKSFTINEQEYYELCKFITKEKQDLDGILNIVAADNLGYYGSLEGNLHTNPWRGCPAGTEVGGIESNGNIKACLSIMHPQAIAGNIREKSFSEIWNNDEIFEFFRNFKGTEGLCGNCNRASDCKGGCSATLVGFNNQLKREYPYCVKRYEESLNL